MGSRKESHAERGFEREARSTPGDHVNQQLRVLPRLVLQGADVHRRPFHVPEVHIALADTKLVAAIAHRGRSIAASARLVKQQRTVLRNQLAEHGRCFGSDVNALDVAHVASQKNPSFFGA